MNEEHSETILQLHAAGAIKYGTFELRKDFFSPFHIDLSGVISKPEIAKQLSTLFWEKVVHLNFELLTGSSPFSYHVACYIAWEQNLPFVSIYQEKVVGTYRSGEKCLLLQGVDFSGAQTLEMIDCLEREGIVVRDVLMLIDCGLGTKAKIKSRGFIYHNILTMADITQYLFDKGKLAGDTYKLASDFLENV